MEIKGPFYDEQFAVDSFYEKFNKKNNEENHPTDSLKSGNSHQQYRQQTGCKSYF